MVTGKQRVSNYYRHCVEGDAVAHDQSKVPEVVYVGSLLSARHHPCQWGHNPENAADRQRRREENIPN